MKLSTAESIPVDVYVLILDQLSFKDLGSFQLAYASEPKMSKIAKWRSLLRLSNFFTKGEARILTIIDGERSYYKINRNEEFRQARINGRAAATRPFRPFTATTNFDRIFTGTPRVPKMVMKPSSEQLINTTYAPIDWTGAPAEVVETEVSFTLGDEVIILKYDTDAISVPTPKQTYSEDGTLLYRTIRHRLPLVRAICRDVEKEPEREYELPKDWIEFLGQEAFVNVVFQEHIASCRVLLTGIWVGRAKMESFEMDWNIKLQDWCCSDDVIDMWRENHRSLSTQQRQHL